MVDVIIIGAGPAGMTAAIYAKRSNLDVILIEKGAPGGQIVNTFEIENYPGFLKGSGADLALNMFQTVEDLDIRYEYGDCLEINKLEDHFEVVTDIETFEAKKVIVATGSSRRMLECKGEEELVGSKISFCAVCDGSFYKNKRIGVIGGGNSAVEEARYLADIGEHVTVIQDLAYLTAEPKACEKLLSMNNVDVLYNKKVLEYKYLSDKDQVEIVFTDNSSVVVDGIFTFIGLKPNSEIVSKFGIVNKYGFIETNEHMETSVEGLFAVGDVRVKNIRQVVTATNDGAIASLKIKEVL